MNVLVIGNGFDLYHKLPTKYSDFLNTIIYLKNIILINKICFNDEKKINDILKNSFNNNTNFKIKNEEYNLKYNNINIHKITKLTMLAYKNIWLNHFIDNNIMDENWVDFENELENVIIIFDKIIELYKTNNNKGLSIINSNQLSYSEKNLIFSNLTKEFWDCKFDENIKLKINSIYLNNGFEILSNKIFNKLRIEFDELIHCFEIYLTEIVEKVKINVYAQEIINENFNLVLSFNYTKTYSRSYFSLYTTITNIHGSIGTDNNNDLVLGISDKYKSNNFDLMFFRKYFQRLQKRTFISYRDKLEKESNIIYFFGLSMDIKDEDIIKYLIKSENTNKIYIYYHNDTSYNNILINLIQIIGKESLLNLYNKRIIEFKLLKKPIKKHNESIKEKQFIINKIDLNIVKDSIIKSRLEKKYSIIEVAKKLKIPTERYKKFENGELIPKNKEIIELCSILDIDSNKIFLTDLIDFGE